MIKLLKILCSLTLLITLNVSALDGPGTSGGGDHEFGEFYYLGDVLFNDFKNANVASDLLDLAIQAFEELRQTKIYPKFTTEHLIINDKEVTAINDWADFSLVFRDLRVC